MKIAILLHAYQPPTQFPKVLEKIVRETYAPLLQTLQHTHRGKLTLNLVGSLVEQLKAQGFSEIVEGFRELSSRGSIELVGTAAYHPLLPKLPISEIKRQDDVNRLINAELFATNRPEGFFIPEMWNNLRVLSALNDMGYRWTVLSESAFPGAGIIEKGQHASLGTNKKLYVLKDKELVLFFRDRPLSLMLAFNHTLTYQTALKAIKEHIDYSGDEYMVLAVDAETFGHHIKGNLSLLRELLDSDELEFVGISDLLTLPLEKQAIEPVEATWGVIEQEKGERVFIRWDNEDNPIHVLQWELFNLALSVGVHESANPDVLDKALHSDQFWWASMSPCWHAEMIKRGTDMLKNAIDSSPKVTKTDKKKAERLYANILREVELKDTGVVVC